MHMQSTFKPILCSLLCAGCACVSAQTLRIATLPAADSIVLDVAVNEGLFKKEGLDVQTVPFKSALEVGAALRAGQLAGHFGDLMNVFTQNETGAAQAVVITTTHNTPAQRAFGMVVSPKHVDKIKSLNDQGHAHGDERFDHHRLSAHPNAGNSRRQARGAQEHGSASDSDPLADAFERPD